MDATPVKVFEFKTPAGKLAIPLHAITEVRQDNDLCYVNGVQVMGINYHEVVSILRDPKDKFLVLADN